MINNSEELAVIANKGSKTAEQLLEYKNSMKRILEFLASN
jgi:hypothetical protein